MPTPIAPRTAMTSCARYRGPLSETPAIVGVGIRHPGANACAVISTTLAPRITKAQKMNEWRTPAYHSRATFLWKIPYTMKFFRRVGRWSHRRSFAFPEKRYRRRRYIFRPKIDRATARNAAAAKESIGLSPIVRPQGGPPFQANVTEGVRRGGRPTNSSYPYSRVTTAPPMVARHGVKSS